MGLKKLFQSTEPLHKMSIGEAAELGIRYVLVGLKQKQLIDQELKRTELELLEISRKQASLKEMSAQLDNIKTEIVENKINGNSPELEKIREEKFLQSKASIVKLWKKGDINWDAVVPGYQFQDKKTAMEWFRKRIEGDIK